MIQLSKAAKKLNVSGTGLSKAIKRIGIEKIKKGRYTFLNDSDFEKLQTEFATSSEPKFATSSNEFGTSSEPQIEYFKKQLEFLHSQLKEKDNTINKLQNALNQEQFLHAGTMKELQNTKEDGCLIAQPEEITWFTDDQLEGWIAEREMLQNELNQLIN